MALMALGGFVPDWFTPKQGGEDEDKTSFKLKPLDGLELHSVMSDSFVGDDGNIRLNKRGRNEALSKGLVGWKNFKSDKNKNLKFSVTNFNRIAPTLIDLIVNEIIDRSQLTADEIKN